MLAVTYAYKVALSNHNSEHKIHAELSTIEFILSFSKTNEPYHTRFEKNTSQEEQTG